jgi:hypothetical protein
MVAVPIDFIMLLSADIAEKLVLNKAKGRQWYMVVDVSKHIGCDSGVCELRNINRLRITGT